MSEDPPATTPLGAAEERAGEQAGDIEEKRKEQREQQREEDSTDPLDPIGPKSTRFELVWKVMVFQLKLAADGLRDVILVPVSLLSAIAGILTQREDPALYFRAVLKLGRRSEHWINLFGYRKGRGTADAMLKPIETKVLSEAENNPHLRRAGETVNQSIDRSMHTVSEAISRQEARHESRSENRSESQRPEQNQQPPTTPQAKQETQPNQDS